METNHNYLKKLKSLEINTFAKLFLNSSDADATESVSVYEMVLCDVCENNTEMSGLFPIVPCFDFRAKNRCRTLGKKNR